MVPVTVFLLGAGLSCATDTTDSAAGTSWVGTISTEGNVTIVVNEAGSLWDGPARLVEEASIGVESGADEYLLDDASSAYATDEVIFIAQPSVPAVRRYSFDGAFLGDVGGPGQGPGEYETPLYVAASADRIFVYDGQLNRVNVYDGGGNAIETWAEPGLSCCIWPLVLSPEGTLHAPMVSWEGAAGPDSPRYGVEALGEENPRESILWVPEIDHERRTLSVLGGEWEIVPFAPRVDWAAAPVGLVAGASDRYRFEVVRWDGSRTIVERYWQPIPVHPEHAAWARRYRVASIQEQAPGWTWSGDEIPDRQRAFDQLSPTASGEIWVLRSGASEQVAECPEDPGTDLLLAYSDPCWRGRPIIDVFGAGGRYHGEIEIPAGLRAQRQSLFARDGVVLGVVEDDAGTVRVKRYALVPPGQHRP